MHTSGHKLLLTLRRRARSVLCSQVRVQYSPGSGTESVHKAAWFHRPVAFPGGAGDERVMSRVGWVFEAGLCLQAAGGEEQSRAGRCTNDPLQGRFYRLWSCCCVRTLNGGRHQKAVVTGLLSSGSSESLQLLLLHLLGRRHERNIKYKALLHLHESDPMKILFCIHSETFCLTSQRYRLVCASSS